MTILICSKQAMSRVIHKLSVAEFSHRNRRFYLSFQNHRCRPKTKERRERRGMTTSGLFNFIDNPRTHNISRIYRDKAGETVEPQKLASAPDDVEETFEKQSRLGFSGFSSLGMADNTPAEVDDEDFGGLMVRMRDNMLE